MAEQFRWSYGDDASNDGIDVFVHYNSRRRTRLGIVFDERGALFVDAPPNTTLSEVQSILNTNGRWLRNKAKQASNDSVCWYPSDYVDDIVLYFRGRARVLKTEARNDVVLDDDVVRAPRTNTKGHVWHWYREQADRLLPDLLEHCCKDLPWVEATPPCRHRFMRSRWGSCSGSGRISLNSHLVKLSDDLVEYVILHELCHLQYLHHGPGFKQLMDTHMPDWKVRSKSLDRHVGFLVEPAPERKNPV